MKRICKAFAKRHREKHLELIKGGGAMFRKLLNMVMLAALLTTASSLAKPVYASSTSEAYIVLTCTVTLSVSLTGSTTWFNLGNVSAGTTVYSTNGVTIRNDSQGAICTWALNVDPASLNGWTLANSAGLNQLAIYGVFQSTQNVANYSTIFSTTAQTYNASTGVFSCGGYTSPEAGYIVESRIVPSSMNGVGTYSSDRNLWIKLLTPLAVTDQTPRSIGIVITASMAG